MTGVDADASILERLALVYAATWSDQVNDVLLAPRGFGTTNSLEDAVELMPERVRGSLLPICLVDDRSIAVVVLDDSVVGLQPGSVLRLVLADVATAHQLQLLDIDPLLYIASLDEELASRQAGLDRVLDEVGPAYLENHIAKEKRPRDFVVRPVRIACQNVIVALAAFNQDAAFDGLGVVAWQTCEVPHVGTNEANRALTALMLCDAFKSGGTMEIRFDRPATVEVNGQAWHYRGHPESKVPAGLRRFGRTVGVELGIENPVAISPSEARRLFRAVTPMPQELRARVDFATNNEGIAPERLYFALMTGTWHPLELDFMLATSEVTASVVSGGAAWTDRSARQAESDVCRAGTMLATLHSRLNNRDSAGADGVRVLEDDRQGIEWIVDADRAAVKLSGLDPSAPLPWSGGKPAATTVTVFPRTTVTDETVSAVRAAQADGLAALLVPLDSALRIPRDIQVLRCPERLADLDKAIEGKLLTSRIARA